jgi:putative photosynthetic complex assembly protein
MSNIDRETFPRWTLIAAGCLISMSIVGAAVARNVRLAAEAEAASAPRATPLAVRDLHFADTAEGAVEVTDAANAHLVYVAEPGADGFIRGVMRGMARDRRARGIDQAPAFRLAEWPDGRLTLEDLGTGKEIELSAFGADNRAAFHQLLGARGDT